MKLGTRGLAGILLVGFGGLGGWSLHQLFTPAVEEAEHEDGAAPAETNVKVRIESAQVGDLPLVVKVLGKVETDPAAIQVLSSRSGGIVESLLIEPGSHVQQGQLLATFDSTPRRAQLAEAQADVLQFESALAEWDRMGRAERGQLLEAQVLASRSQLELTEQQVGRLEPLLEKGLVAAKTAEEARMAAELARANLKQANDLLQHWNDGGADLQRQGLLANLAAAKARREEAQALLTATQVHAMSAGVVTTLDTSVGMQIDGGGAIGTVQVSGATRVLFGLDPEWSGRIPTNGTATWRDSHGGEGRGRVISRLPGVDPSTGLIRVIVEPDESAPGLEPGQFLEGELEYGRTPQAVLIPSDALIRADEAQVVVVVDAQDISHTVPVKVLARHSGSIAVEGDLAVGARVVVQGGYNLPDGTHVVIEAAEGN
ncbi:MAG: efflux RND transporter periplasmic adaptor subunit [Planctomycetota bacterium]